MNTNTGTNDNINASSRTTAGMGTGTGTGIGTSIGTGARAGTGTGVMGATGAAGAGAGPATTVSTSKQTTNPIKAAAAAVHGAGEVVRGTINSAVEGAFNESGGVVKSNNTTSQGIDEIETGRFSHGTKNREGVIPGSNHEARRGI